MGKRTVDKFRQVHDSNKEGKDGSGLGVAIASAIVKLLGACIWVELGEGSLSPDKGFLCAPRLFWLSGQN